jgi:hypothetical protein
MAKAVKAYTDGKLQKRISAQMTGPGVEMHTAVLTEVCSTFLESLRRPSNQRIIWKPTPLGAWQARGSNVIVFLTDPANGIFDLRALEAAFERLFMLGEISMLESFLCRQTLLWVVLE